MARQRVGSDASEATDEQIVWGSRDECCRQSLDGLQRARIRAKPDRLSRSISGTDEDAAAWQPAAIVEHVQVAATARLPEPHRFTRREPWPVALDTPSIEQQRTAFATRARGQMTVPRPGRDSGRANAEEVGRFVQCED